MKNQRPTCRIRLIEQVNTIKFLLTITALLIQPMLMGQGDTAYSFIVAGHAYGAHSGGNPGLHPAFLNSLNAGFDTGTCFFILTGDIVNQSTSESWEQVENELVNYGLPYYYVMGNHDANDIGHQVFEDKFGGTWYAFNSHSELFIILNSTEEQRSISSDQISFLEEQISKAGDTIRNIFIFFHEVLWNSHEKYVGVKSNSRSRFDQIVNYSNYWEEVHPLLLTLPEKKFYIIAGDVGGNPDAIAAFYDTWDNITLLASGMGEVTDENYLQVHVDDQDSVKFELVPLNSGLSLLDIEYYSVPPAPEAIAGPALVNPGNSNIIYYVPEVFNAEYYIWTLPGGDTDTLSSNSIPIDFDADFTGSPLSVCAFKEGFGSGPVVSMMIEADNPPDKIISEDIYLPQIECIEDGDYINLLIAGYLGEELIIRLVDGSGKVLKSNRIKVWNDYTILPIQKPDLSQGIVFLSVSTYEWHVIKKIQVW